MGDDEVQNEAIGTLYVAGNLIKLSHVPSRRRTARHPRSTPTATRSWPGSANVPRACSRGLQLRGQMLMSERGARNVQRAGFWDGDRFGASVARVSPDRSDFARWRASVGSSRGRLKRWAAPAPGATVGSPGALTTRTG